MKTHLPAAIELLEPRIAPASVLTFVDVDGDSVKITSTLGDLNAAGVATKMPGAITGEQLTLLDLRGASFQGTTITTAVKRAAGGDGFVHIGRIDATGRDLAAVKIKGDLAVIDVGDADTSAASPALKLLDVRSMGRFGLSTQGAGDLASDFAGTLGVLKVAGDIVGASIFASGGAGGVDGKIGSATIGGSLIGGDTVFSGTIRSTGDMGAVKIGRNVMGGEGQSSAAIQSDFGAIKSVTIRGSMYGGTGSYDTFIDAGVTKRRGQINAEAGIGSISVGGSIVGGLGPDGGEIRSPATIGSVKVGGSLIGGEGIFTVQISSGTLGKLTVGGSIIGGDGNQSGFVTGSSVGNVTVGGSVIGGAGNFAGGIFAAGNLPGSVKIGGDLIGGSGGTSGRVGSNGVVGNVTVGGSVIGGSATGSGVIAAGGNGPLGAVRIGGDLIGGSISGSEPTLNLVGAIQSGGRIASVTIGGSIIAGIDTSTVGTLTNSGVIRAQDDIGAITIKGSLLGNEVGALQQVIISARGQKTLAADATTDLAIKSVTIGGHVELAKILGGFDPGDADNAGSNGNASIGAVKVGGDWFASSISAGVNAANLGFGAPGTVINVPPGAAADAIVARIASIAIKGVVAGAPNIFFQAGFTAQQIGSFKAGAYTAPLTAVTDPAILLTNYTGNVTIREI